MIARSFLLSASSLVAAQNYTNLGCWLHSTWDPPLISNENKGYTILNGPASTRTNPALKCFQVAVSLNHTVFGLQNGACFSRLDTVPGGSYTRYGSARSCPVTGIGATLINNVYQVNVTLLPQRRLDYYNLGCFNDLSTSRALTTNEGRGFTILNGVASARTNSTEKCFTVALQLGHTVFAVQNGSCYSFFGTVPGSYAKYNTPITCPTSGTGANLVNNVYQVNPALLPQQRSDFFNLGCFRDNATAPALIRQEGKGFSILDGSPATRANATEKCSKVAISLGHNVFSLQSGACFSAVDTVPNGRFTRYGPSSTCPTSGLGASLVNNVYQINATLLPQTNSNYVNLACFRDDASNPALDSNEGKEIAILDGSSATRTDPINKCFQAALGQGHNVFAVRSGACFSAVDTVPNGNFARYGPSSTCPTSGFGASLLGGTLINNVYQVNASLLPQRSDYVNLGCFKDNSTSPALVTIEAHVGGEASTRLNAVGKCFEVASRLGHTIFAVQNGSCYSLPDTEPGSAYSRYGASSVCPTNGLGDKLINNVYQIRSHYTNLGCFIDSPFTASLPSNEISVFSNLLNGDPSTRENAVQKCYQVAQMRGHNVFALQNGSCYSAWDTVPGGKYSQYGPSPSCANDGRGGRLINNVYQINAVPRFNEGTPFISLGCWSNSETSVNFLRTLEAPRNIQECYEAALKRGMSVFALSYHGCRGALDDVLSGDYSSGSQISNCPSDGLGAFGIHHVYLIRSAKMAGETLNVPSIPYVSEGCWNDGRGFETLRKSEGYNAILDGPYQNRIDAINKCYQVALMRNHTHFALQDNGMCSSSIDGVNQSFFATNNRSSICARDGLGHSRVNHVFRIRQTRSFYGMYDDLWCYSIRSSTLGRAIASLETVDPNLCFQIAKFQETRHFGFVNGRCYVFSSDVIDISSRATLAPNSKELECGYKTLSSVYIRLFRIKDEVEVNRISNATSLGCWSSDLNTRLKSAEGLSSTLDGRFDFRSDAIKKCFQTAHRFGHNTFALQNGGQCYTMLDLSPNNNISFTNASASFKRDCHPDGRGLFGINHVFRIKTPLATLALNNSHPYTSLGCWLDHENPSNKLMLLNEGIRPLLEDHYRTRSEAIQKCYQVALQRGHKIFALQDGGRCYSMIAATPAGNYSQYGSSPICPESGLGALNINHVYQIKQSIVTPNLPAGVSSIGCFTVTDDESKHILRLNEGSSIILDGDYRIRTNALQKCHNVTRSRGYNMFALRDGGQCYSVLNVGLESMSPQMNVSCPATGSLTVIRVYSFASQAKISFDWGALPYSSLGCFKASSDMNATFDNYESSIGGDYQSRTDAIGKCYQVALTRGLNIFLLQEGGKCLAGFDIIPGGDYIGIGSSVNCPIDGLGTKTVNHVYRIYNISSKVLTFYDLPFRTALGYSSLGCWKDEEDFSRKLLTSQEGLDPTLNDNPLTRVNPIEKCFAVADSKGHNVFAIQRGLCFSKYTAIRGGDYDTLGKSEICPNHGRGALNVNHVYRNNRFDEVVWSSSPSMTSKFSFIGCFQHDDKNLRLKDGAITTIDSLDRGRVEKWNCYKAALSRGHNIFALRDGITCYTSLDYIDENQAAFSRAGKLEYCSNGFFVTGSLVSVDQFEYLGIDHTYYIRNAPISPEAVTTSSKWISLGCFYSGDTPSMARVEEGQVEEQGSNSFMDQVLPGSWGDIQGPYLFPFASAIENCYQQTRDNNHKFFALHNGVLCMTYDGHPAPSNSLRANECLNDGAGGTPFNGNDTLSIDTSRVMNLYRVT